MHDLEFPRPQLMLLKVMFVGLALSSASAMLVGGVVTLLGALIVLLMLLMYVCIIAMFARECLDRGASSFAQGFGKRAKFFSFGALTPPDIAPWFAALHLTKCRLTCPL